ncbi:MAG: deoxyhypusine synthase [Candidatus Baldrarchaeia archaeon]
MSEIRPIKISKGLKVSDLIHEYGKAGVFGAGRVSRAVEILSEMFSDDKATVYLGFSGALCAAGMRQIFAEMIKEGLLDVIVTTGANVTHDIIEALGGRHIRNIKYLDDEDLRRRQLNRIFDAFISDEAFITFEKKIQMILSDIEEKKRKNGIAPFELIWEIGYRINDPNSMVRQAALNNVPIFCPAIVDSILGLQIYLFSQENTIKIDPLKDLRKIIDITFESDRKGAIILGGGVPKNFIFQAALITGKGFDYAIQITMDRPEAGGLSGASIAEAISWGKVKSDAQWIDVIGDVTIIFPLILSAALDNMGKGKGSTR